MNSLGMDRWDPILFTKLYWPSRSSQYTIVNSMGSHRVCNHWMYQYYGFGLMMAQWAETCGRIFNFLILITNICCVIDEINLLYLLQQRLEFHIYIRKWTKSKGNSVIILYYTTAAKFISQSPTKAVSPADRTFTHTTRRQAVYMNGRWGTKIVNDADLQSSDTFRRP